MSEKGWHLVTYDIADRRRLTRVHRHLRACGYCLQESVFLWHGDRRELERLQADLINMARESEDDLRCFPLARGHDIHWWGRPPLPRGVIITDGPPLRFWEKISVGFKR